MNSTVVGNGINFSKLGLYDDIDNFDELMSTARSFLIFFALLRLRKDNFMLHKGSWEKNWWVVFLNTV